MSDDEFTLGDMRSWCTRCGREIDPGPECSNLHCQRAAEPECIDGAVLVGDGDGSDWRPTPGEYYVQWVDRGTGRVGLSEEMAGAVTLELALDALATWEWAWTGETVLAEQVWPSSGPVREPPRAPTRPREATPVPASRRKLWRGMDGGQSVIVLQWMGGMWAQWGDWGLVDFDDGMWSSVARSEI